MPNFNAVIFVPNPPAGQENSTLPNLPLMLSAPWKLTPGLKANVNRATCRAIDFAPYISQITGANATLTGQLQFWYSQDPDGDGTTPDHEIGPVCLIDVDVVEVGQALNNGVLSAAGPVLYELYLADDRHRFSAPRGGRLEYGLLNPSQMTAAAGPSLPAADTANDSSGSAPTNTAPLRRNSVLIGWCLQAMGLPSVQVPSSVDQIDPPLDLKWLGNHAPTELAKLLVHCGHFFVMLSSGEYGIYQEGNGTDPTSNIPASRLILSQNFPAIDRRGKTVIFTSYPYANTITASASGPVSSGNTGWEFVAQDADDTSTSPSTPGPYKRIDSLTICANPTAWIQSGFSASSSSAPPAQYASNLRNQLYKYLRFAVASDDSETPDPDSAPILRRIVENVSVRELSIQAKHAVSSGGSSPTYSNITSNVPVEHLFHGGGDQGNIFVASDWLGQVSASGVSDLYAAFQAPSPADVTIRYTREATNHATDSDGNVFFQPQYNYIGFEQMGAANGGIVQLSQSQAQNAINSNDPDTIIIHHPKYALRTIDGSAVNTQQVTTIAQAEAAAILKHSGDPPKIIMVAGFYAADPDGLVSEISYDQEKVITTIKLATWYAPVSGILSLRDHVAFAEGGAYPNQSITEAARKDLGVRGETAPVAPIGHVHQPPQQPGGMFVAPLRQNGGTNGTGTTAATYTYDILSQDGSTTLVGTATMLRPRINGEVTAAGYGYVSGPVPTGLTASPAPMLYLLEAWEVYQTQDTCTGS